MCIRDRLYVNTYVTKPNHSITVLLNNITNIVLMRNVFFYHHALISIRINFHMSEGRICPDFVTLVGTFYEASSNKSKAICWQDVIEVVLLKVNKRR